MVNIHAMNADEVPCYIAEQCHALCNPNSEMQGRFQRLAMLALNESDHAARIAYCWVHGDEEGPEIVGWACVSEWIVGDETRVQAQGFVREDYRQRGIALAMCVALTHDLPRDALPVAVFSPEFRRIAQRLKWNATEYRLVNDGWIGVGTVERREV
jgi:GNAT superfamily N-acetyltransferase